MSNIHQLVKIKYQCIEIPNEWEGIISEIKKYKPQIHCLAVRCELPEQWWIKCNTDGASRGNPRESSCAFCTRKNDFYLVYAELRCMEITKLIEYNS